mgnify:CR=1 FL=1
MLIPAPPPLPAFPVLGIQAATPTPAPASKAPLPPPPHPVVEEAHPTQVKRGRPPGKRSEEDVNFLASQEDGEYRGPPAILTLEARDILANRYSVTASGTRKKGNAVLWEGFQHFYEYIRLHAPENFSVDGWRIYHDPKSGPPNSIGPDNIRFLETGKARLHTLEKKARLTDVKISANSALMILLAAEIAGRICIARPGVSIQQILLESLAAVDMDF